MALTTTQKRILGQAFEKNPFPDPATRKKLAKQTGILESRILMWFQNQNSLYSEQRRELLNVLVESTNERPDVTLQQQHINLSMLPCAVHSFPPSSSSCSKQTFLPAPLPSQVFSELWDPFQVCVSQGPSVTVKQPTQAMEGGESSDFPLTFMDHLLKLLTPGENFSDTQAPFCYQYQEKCQNDKGYSGTGALQGKNHSQPHPQQKEQEFPGLGHIDISYIMQWWDKGRQALITEWEPLEETP
ncbi:double homeobox protein 4C [Heterocephalus glaber]|uniref:Double homeobox protein 4C n=1 Tax=Heterocephalus glaber TaxID=10181 RepID=A0AAX6QVY2_HETGA|nr:double homeobox protein 4C [Heterocephalus glaber]